VVLTQVRTRRARTRMRHLRPNRFGRREPINRHLHEAIVRISRQTSCAIFLTAGKPCPIFETAEGLRYI
jgi:hypothetical protein